MESQEARQRSSVGTLHNSWRTAGRRVPAPLMTKRYATYSAGNRPSAGPATWPLTPSLPSALVIRDARVLPAPLVTLSSNSSVSRSPTSVPFLSPPSPLSPLALGILFFFHSSPFLILPSSLTHSTSSSFFFSVEFAVTDTDASRTLDCFCNQVSQSKCKALLQCFNQAGSDPAECLKDPVHAQLVADIGALYAQSKLQAASRS